MEVGSAQKDEFETKYLKAENYEPAPREVQHKESSKSLLKISDLKKSFPTGTQAVAGVNLKVYTG